MKRTMRYNAGNKQIEREVSYIPVRYILAVSLAVFEVLAVLSIVIFLCLYVPYFYLLMWITEIAAVIRIIASDDNPDYKVPWLLIVLVAPVVGLMTYIMFRSRKLKAKYVRRMKKLKDSAYRKCDDGEFASLFKNSIPYHSQAVMLKRISDAHLFKNTRMRYFPLGEDMFKCMLDDLKKAEKFIFLEYFIIEEGVFFGAILDVLKEKAKAGVEVRVLYDDIGCMNTLPGDYFKKLRKENILASPFGLLKGNADSEFNNRSHRKILVIDGKVGYTGGVNLADEYINAIVRFGHWKDVGIRLEGEAVLELTKLFLIDYGLNVRKEPEARFDYFCAQPCQDAQGFVMPFGDGPAPIYTHQVGKSVIQNLLNQAKEYVYMMTPYLICDNEMMKSIENAAYRGVDVRIIVPHIPDKKLVFELTKSYCERLMNAGVRIYEYEPGFIHAKCYLCDGEAAMVGSINLDYRSLTHHFENGVWMYKTECIEEIKKDFDDTFEKSIVISKDTMKASVFRRFIRAVLKIFAPMM